jgi:hypothetical protein
MGDSHQNIARLILAYIWASRQRCLPGAGLLAVHHRFIGLLFIARALRDSTMALSERNPAPPDRNPVAVDRHPALLNRPPVPPNRAPSRRIAPI